MTLVALFVWLALRSRNVAPFPPNSNPQLTQKDDTRAPGKLAPSPVRPPEAPQPERRINDRLADREGARKTLKGGGNTELTVTCLLSGAIVRESQPDPVVTISPRTRFLQLEIVVSEDDCAAYSAVLLTDSQEPIQRWEKLRPRHNHSTSWVVLRVSAEALENSAYQVRLGCESRNENPAAGALIRFRLEKTSP
jgi:hypothetical protein